MSKQIGAFALGQAQVNIINIGDITLPMAKHLTIPEDELNTRTDLYGLKDQQIAPIQNCLVRLPTATVLIDAGHYGLASTDPDYHIEGYTPPPSLVDQLSALGVGTEALDHVIITHRHWDHFNATTHEVNEKYVPQFPNATYYLSEADWAKAEIAMSGNENAIEHHTLNVLHQAGVLTLVEDDLDLGHGVQILSAPGETVGHQVVKIQSDEKTLYCLGDLYHHPAEFHDIGWHTAWANPDLTRNSRNKLLPNILSESALIFATHIPEIGKLKQQGDQLLWEATSI